MTDQSSWHTAAYIEGRVVEVDVVPSQLAVNQVEMSNVAILLEFGSDADVIEFKHESRRIAVELSPADAVAIGEELIRLAGALPT